MSDDATTVYETLGDEPDRGSGGAGRGFPVVPVIAVVLALVLGGSAFAAYKLLHSSGAQPAEALPADTFAVVSFDLDPSAGQKVEAIKTLRKFPGFKKEVGLDSDDDLREFFVKKLIEEGDCTDVSYARDVEPWLGKRAAFGGVDLGEDQPAPVIALQVSDTAGAKAGFAKLVDCAEPGDDFGFTVGEEYLIASDSTEHAKQIAADAAKKSLAADASYQRWTDEVGDAGVVNVYVSEGAKDLLLQAMDQFGQGFEQGFRGEMGGELSGMSGSDEESRKMLEDQLKDFEGLAAALRFADGGMELAVVGKGIDGYTGSGKAGAVGDLPADTAALLALSVPDDIVESTLDQLRATFGDDVDSGVQEFEAQTGLTVPEDVQALLGDTLSLSLGGKAPENLNDIASPADVPFGLLISGDADRIEEVIAKIEQSTGASLEDMQVVHQQADDKVVLASSEDYADELLEGGKLGSEDRFTEAVPEAEKAGSVLFVDFNSDWTDAVVRTYEADTGDDGKELEENLEPLGALGISSWMDGENSRILLKLTTD
ncbi:MAG TPA: DUF3352 domain-containing protein [Marmoricola sp.]|nr:DUF3352 domain-containing protein [Marmoricola sp.]